MPTLEEFLASREEEETGARGNRARALPLEPGPSPDEAARDQRDAETIREVPEVVRLQPALRQAAQGERDAAVLRDAPRLEAWLAERENGLVARDDVQNLSFWERLDRNISPWASRLGGPFLYAASPDARRRVGEAWRQGQRNIETARLYNRMNTETWRWGPQFGFAEGEAPQPLTNQDYEQLYDLNRQRFESRGIIEPVAEVLPQILGGIEAGFRRAVHDTKWSLDQGDYSNNETYLNAPFAALTAGTLGAYRGVVGFTYEQEAGAAFQEFRQMVDEDGNAIDPQIAGKYAREVGEINAIIEMIGLGVAVRSAKLFGLEEVVQRLASAPVRGAIRRAGFREAITSAARGAAGAALAEGTTEMSQEGVNIMLGRLAQQAQGGRWEQMEPDEIATRLWDSFRVGATVGGVLGAGGTTPSFIADVREIRHAQAQHDLFTAIAGASSSSRVRGRARPRYEAAVNAMLANGPLEEFRIDADRLAAFFQERNQDPISGAAEIGIDGEAMRAAMETGGEVAISSGAYAARVAGTPLDEGIRQHVRLGPDRMTPAEVSARIELGVDLERAASEADRLQSEAMDTLDDSEIAQERIAEMISGAEAFVPDANRKFARFFGSAFANLAQRGGRSTNALLDQIGLDIRGPMESVNAQAAFEQRSPDQERGTEAFQDDRLTPSENKAVEMARNRYSNAEIAEEMETSPNAVAVLLNRAKKKAPGTEIPSSRTGRPKGTGQVTIDQLVKMRAQLRNKMPDRQIRGVIAERLGIKPTAVTLALWRHDRQVRARAQDINPTVLRFGSTEQAVQLLDRIDAGAKAEEVLFSPLYRAIEKHVQETGDFATREQMMDPEFFEARTYVDPSTGRELGWDQAIARLVDVYQSLAEGGVAKEKRAVIVIGLPGAGKSTYIQRLAREYRAAVADADVAKAFIPQYENGFNTQAVHWESAKLRHVAADRLMSRGANIIVERVGDKADVIMAQAEALQERGYSVRLVHIDVNYDEAARRQARRFLSSGRYIAPDFFRSLADASPKEAFTAVLEQYPWAGYVEINANGTREEAKETRKGGVEAGDLARSALGRQSDAVLESGDSAGARSRTPDEEGTEFFQEDRELDQSGFFSVALEAAKALPDRAMKPSEAIGRILKARGVSGMLGSVKDEVAFLGLNEEFGARKSVKPSEIVDYIRAHRLVLTEAFNRFDPNEARRAPNLSEWTAVADHTNAFGEQVWSVDRGSYGVVPMNAPSAEEAIRRAADELSDTPSSRMDAVASGIRRGPGDLRLPGDDPVFELRLMIPEGLSAADVERRAEIMERLDPKSGALADAERIALLQELEQIKARRMPGSDFDSHWSRPPSNNKGVLVSVRGEERIDDQGKRTLFGGEVQSDLGQQVRTRKEQREELRQLIESSQRVLSDNPEAERFVFDAAQYKWTAVPESGRGLTRADVETDLRRMQDQYSKAEAILDAPLASKTSSWTGAAVRALVYRAARDGFDSVSFPTGETSALIQGNDSAAEHYDTNVKGAAQKIARAFGVELREGSVKYNPQHIEDWVDLQPEQAEGMLKALWERLPPVVRGTLRRDLPNMRKSDSGEFYVASASRPGSDDSHVSADHFNFIMRREARNNPLIAAYQIWVQGAMIFGESGAFGRLIEAAGGKNEAVQNALREAIAQGEQAPAYVLPITPEMRERVLNQGLPLFQTGPNAGPRGSVSFSRDQAGRINRAMIKLYEARNLSTLLHEGGHVFLETLALIASDPDATQQVKDDWATTLDWMGLTPEQWNAMATLPEAEAVNALRPYHERWARSFEAYLYEGKAPSLALQDVFAAFKRWLRSIYQGIQAIIGTDTLSDDIRGVMDRIVASEQAIDEARQAQGADAIIPRDKFGGTDRQYEQYQKNIARAREAAAADVEAEAMGALIADRTRWWRSEEKRVRKAAEIDVDSQPARRALDWLGLGLWRHGDPPVGLEPMRLSPQSIIENYGQEMLDRLPPALGKSDGAALFEHAKEMRGRLRRKPPLRFASWIQQQGGIKDPNGDVKAILGDARARPGLINNATGRDPDDMALIAWEEGYFGQGPQRSMFEQDWDSENKFLYQPPQSLEEASANLLEVSRAHPEFWEQVREAEADPERNKRPGDIETYDQNTAAYAVTQWADWIPAPEQVREAIARNKQAATRNYEDQRNPTTANQNLTQRQELAQAILKLLEQNGGSMDEAEIFRRINEERGHKVSASEIAKIRWRLSDQLSDGSDKLFQGERPTVREFLDKLEGDLKNTPAYRLSDEELVAEREEAERMRDWFAERGVDIMAKDADLKAQVSRIAAREDAQGVDPDLAASVFGFESGEELLNAIANLGSRKEEIDAETRKRMLDAYGDPFADGSIHDEARIAAHREAQAKVIETELDAIERATGGAVRPVSRAAKDIAQAQIERMSIRQIRKFDWFLANERRQAKAALKAMEEGDLTGARTAKHRQLVNFHLYALARKATEEVDRAQAYFRRLTERDGIRAKIDAEYLAQIDQLLEQYELKPISQREAERRMSLAQWVREMEDRGLGHMVAVDPKIVSRAGRRAFMHLDLSEARGLLDTIKNIEHLGRLKDKLLDAQEKRAFREVVTELADTMQATGPISQAERANYSPNAIERTQDGLRKAHAEMTRMEFLFRYLDGRHNGPLWNRLWRPFAKAADVESAKMRDATKAMDAIWARYTTRERSQMFKTRISMPDLPVGAATHYTKAELIALALNIGNQGNLEALVDGFGWAQQMKVRGVDVDYAAARKQIIDALDRVFDARDWDTVQQVWDLIGSFRDEAFALQKDLTGLDTEAVEAMPVETATGTIAGGYYPLKYDRQRDLRVERAEAKQDVQEMWGSNWFKPMTRKGHLIERVGSGGRPVKLSLGVFTEHVQNVVHDIAYRRAVLDADRIITDPQFSETFVAVAGRPMYDQLRPWLQAIASDRVDPAAMMWQFLQKLRGNVAIAAMGYRVSTALQQLVGITQAVPMLGADHMANGFAKLWARPDRLYEKARWIMGKSEFMRSRPTTLDRDIRETMERMQTSDPLYPIRRHAFALTSAFDWAVSSTVWVSAYEKAMSGKVSGIVAGAEADAIAFADGAVRTTQSAGLPQDLPAIMRGSQVNKLLTMFMSYFSVLYNWSAFDQVMGVRKGRIPPHVFMANMALIYVIAPLIAEALAGRWGPKEDETEEERNARLALVVAKMPFSTIPVVRDIANMIGSSYDYQLSPAGSALDTIGKTASRAASGDLDSEYAAKQGVMSAGYIFGLPAGQAWTMIDYTADKLEGEEEGFDPVEAAVADRR